MSENFKTFIAFALVIGLMCYGFKYIYDKGTERAFSDGYTQGINYEENTFGHDKPTMEKIDGTELFVGVPSARYDWGYFDGYNDGYVRALDEHGISHKGDKFFKAVY